MKAPTIQERSAQLRLSVNARQHDLEIAVATLGRVSAAQVTVGGHMSQAPWQWLAAACVVGLVMGIGSESSR